MKYLFKFENQRDCYEVKVFRHGNEVIAKLKGWCFPYMDKEYTCVAKNSEPEFNLSKGIRLAVARAKKEFLLDQIRDKKRDLKLKIEKLNKCVKTVEFLDKKYLLNRESRSNPEYTKGEYVLGITNGK